MSQFAALWAMWPRKVAKKAAEKAWTAALKRAKPEIIMSAAESYANSRVGQDHRFTVHASTWLNGDRWEDQDGSTQISLESPERKLWRARLKNYLPGTFWPQPWGPRPGEPRFQGPKDLERQALAEGQTVAPVQMSPTTGFGDRAAVAQGLKP